MAEICLGYSFFRDTTRQSDNKEPKTETCAELDKKNQPPRQTGESNVSWKWRKTKACVSEFIVVVKV